MASYTLALPHQRVLGLPDEALRQLDRIAGDAAHAARSFTKAELGGMVFACMCQAAYGTVRTQLKAVIFTARLAGKLVSRLGRLGDVDWRSLPGDICRKCGDAYHRLPFWARKHWKRFLALPKRQREDEVVALFLTVLVFLLVGGGKDLEGGLPDKDMVFGMGAHRHVLSHTILLGLGLEFTLRLWLTFASKAYQRLPEDHHPVWDRLHGILRKSESRLVAAGWAGLGAHLLKDGAFFSEATKPLVGLPGKASMDVHQLIIRSNALAGGLIGMSIIGSPKTKVKEIMAQGTKILFNLGRLKRFMKH